MTRRAMLPILALAATAAACSGGKHSHRTPVTIPAPSNVVASGAFHAVSLSWSPVGGATGYEVFRVRNEDIPGINERGTPIAVASTATTIAPLPNWVPTSWQVAAVVGGAAGTRSPRVSATPSGGRLVGFRDGTGAFAARYRADVPDDTPADVVVDAKYVATLGTSGAIVYEVPSISPHTELGIFTSDATRVIVAATAGHTYSYQGVTATGRWIYSDLHGGSTYDVRSVDFAGADDRVLLSGCTTSPMVRVSLKGVLVNCTTPSTTATTWASDGVAAAINIPGSMAGDILQDYFPDGAIVKRGGLLYRAPLDGVNAATPLSPDSAIDTADSVLAVGSGDTIVFSSHTSDTTPFHLWSVGADGIQRWSTAKKSATAPSAGNAVFLNGVSRDGRHFLAKLPGAPPANNDVVYRFNFNDETDQLTFTALTSGVNDAEAHFLPDDSVVVKAATGTNPWRLYAPGAEGASSTSITSVGSLSSFLGANGTWILFNDQTSTTTPLLTSVSEDLMTVHTISNALANSSHFVWGTDGSDFGYLDKNGLAHEGTPDGSRSAVLDPAASTGIDPSGRTPDGREFWIVTHADGKRATVSLDAAGTVTRILGGSTSDSGYYVP